MSQGVLVSCALRYVAPRLVREAPYFSNLGLAQQYSITTVKVTNKFQKCNMMERFHAPRRPCYFGGSKLVQLFCNIYWAGHESVTRQARSGVVSEHEARQWQFCF